VPQKEPATTPQQGLDSGKSPSAPSEIMLNETMTLVKNESAQNAQDTCIRRDKNRMLLETARNDIATLTMQVAQADVRVAVILSEKTELLLEVRRLQHELEGRDEKIEDLQQENLKLTSGRNPRLFFNCGAKRIN
jgi:hypothetical protein